MSSFESIIGHSAQVAALRNDLEAGNVAHAYLFAGPKHIGKLTMAHAFAQDLLLNHKTSEDTKRTLNEIQRLIHPDILVLDQLWIEDVCEDWNVIAKTSNIPQKHRSKTPKARTDSISIEDIRALSGRLHETGTLHQRCCIIRSAERMQEPAANALLKILEEPPEGMVFILTTESLSSILPTIVSRTRVIHFSRLSKDELSPLLKGLDSDEISFLLHLSQGAPGIITSLRDNPDSLREQHLLHSRANSFWKSSSLSTRLALLEPLFKRTAQSDQFLLHLALTLREQGEVPQKFERSLRELVQGLETNTNRQLLAQRFCLQSVSEPAYRQASLREQE